MRAYVNMPYVCKPMKRSLHISAQPNQDACNCVGRCDIAVRLRFLVGSGWAYRIHCRMTTATRVYGYFCTCVMQCAGVHGQWIVCMNHVNHALSSPMSFISSLERGASSLQLHRQDVSKYVLAAQVSFIEAERAQAAEW